MADEAESIFVEGEPIFEPVEVVAARVPGRHTGRKRVPRWWYRAVQERSTTDQTLVQIAAKMGKHPKAVQMALESPWALHVQEQMDQRASERLIQAGVSPIVAAQLEAPAAMQRIIAASRSAQKPAEIASINKDVLAMAGYVTERKGQVTVQVSLQQRLRDLSDAELERCATTGRIPETIRKALGLPAPEQP